MWVYAWSVRLREEDRLRMLKNRMLWDVFGFKKENVKGCWRKLCSEELNDLYMLQNMVGNRIKEEELSRVCGICREEAKCHWILVGKHK